MDLTIRTFFPQAAIMCRLFDALAAHPYGLSVRDLMWEIYQGENEPEWINVIGTYVCKFNKRAAALGLGLRIHGFKESGRRYRIVIVRP